jgi:hypothetical protein
MHRAIRSRVRSSLSPGSRFAKPTSRYRATSSSGGTCIIVPGHRVGISTVRAHRYAIERRSSGTSAIRTSAASRNRR